MTEAATLPLPERRAAVMTRIADIERERGAALLDGQDADASELMGLHGTLAVIDAASREAERREREEVETAAHAARVEAAGEAAKEIEAFRTAVAAAEKHATALASELKAIMGHATGLRALAPRLGIHPPHNLDATALARALSFAIAEHLVGLDRPRGFGHFAWPSHPTKQDWAAAARPVFDAYLPIIEGLTQ